MKILIPLLLLTLGANANEVVYGSKSGTVESGGESTVKLVDVAAGEAIEIMSVIGGRTVDGEEILRGGQLLFYPSEIRRTPFNELAKVGRNWQ